MSAGLFALVQALMVPHLAAAQPASCPWFSPGGRLPALLNPKLEQRVTVLCNDSYAAAASGVTHGALWSAEHLTAADVAAARDTPRAGPSTLIVGCLTTTRRSSATIAGRAMIGAI